MMCEFNRDLIALHAGGDLPGAESRLVEAHLQTCGECQSLLGEYQKRISLIAGSAIGVRYPGAEFSVGQRQGWNRRWLGAVASVLLIAAAAGLITGGPAIAALVREIRFGQILVREMDAEEAKQYQEQQQSVWDKARRGPRIAAKQVTVAEAIAAVNYHVLQPKYVPDGYEAEGAWIIPDDPTSPVSISYMHQEKGLLEVHQPAPGKNSSTVISHVPEGASQSVTVSGLPAVVTRGAWVVADGKARWRDTFSTRLTYEKGGQMIEVQHGSADFPTAELIKIAESLQ